MVLRRPPGRRRRPRRAGVAAECGHGYLLCFLCPLQHVRACALSSLGSRGCPMVVLRSECCPCDFLLPFSGFWHRQQTLKKMNSFLTAAGAARARQRSECDACDRSRAGRERFRILWASVSMRLARPVVYFFAAAAFFQLPEIVDHFVWTRRKPSLRSTASKRKPQRSHHIMADDAEVDALKAAGNDAFKKGDFSGAVSNYDKAILLAPKNHLLYSNRSLAKHSAGDFVAAKRMQKMPRARAGLHEGCVQISGTRSSARTTWTRPRIP